MNDSQEIAVQVLNKDDSSEKKTVRRCCCFKVSQKCADIFLIIRIRSLLTFAIIYLIGLFVCASNDFVYLYGIFCIVVIWAETIYICVFHDSKDFYW